MLIVLRVGVPVEPSTVESHVSILLAVSFAIKQRGQKRSKDCMVLGVTRNEKQNCRLVVAQKAVLGSVLSLAELPYLREAL